MCVVVCIQSMCVSLDINVGLYVFCMCVHKGCVTRPTHLFLVERGASSTRAPLGWMVGGWGRQGRGMLISQL